MRDRERERERERAFELTRRRSEEAIKKELKERGEVRLIECVAVETVAQGRPDQTPVQLTSITSTTCQYR
jgi:hypothetical protein